MKIEHYIIVYLRRVGSTALLLGCCIAFADSKLLAALSPKITLAKNGTLAWEQSMTNGLVAVDKATNLLSTVWVPYRSLISSNGTGSMFVPLTNKTVFYRVTTGYPSMNPSGMVLVPGGTSQMGDNWQYPYTPTNERPLHVVSIQPFFIDQHEVTFQKMRDVLQWAYTRGEVGISNINNSGLTAWNLQGNPKLLMYLQGYAWKSNFISFVSGQFSVANGWGDYPCTAVTWYGAAAYTAYKSKMEGLQPCINITNWTCDLNQNGYRLPTEAEWEKAARGGLTGNHYPWESYGTYLYYKYIDTNLANYTPTGQPHSFTPSRVGSYAPNGYGIYDMAGNIREWCWDWYDPAWYSQSDATLPDPVGPLIGINCVVRGGGFETQESTLRCAYRDNSNPGIAYWYSGFRAVRRP